MQIQEYYTLNLVYISIYIYIYIYRFRADKNNRAMLIKIVKIRPRRLVFYYILNNCSKWVIWHFSGESIAMRSFYFTNPFTRCEKTRTRSFEDPSVSNVCQRHLAIAGDEKARNERRQLSLGSETLNLSRRPWGHWNRDSPGRLNTFLDLRDVPGIRGISTFPATPEIIRSVHKSIRDIPRRGRFYLHAISSSTKRIARRVSRLLRTGNNETERTGGKQTVLTPLYIRARLL